MSIKWKDVFENYDRSTDFCTERGGKIAQFYGKNACAIRMSYAITKAGLPVTIASDFDDKDGNKYIIKVETMTMFLTDRLGAPKEVTAADVKDKRGILIFSKCCFPAGSGATGHVDLWDKDAAVGTAYWEYASSVFFWELD